MKLSCLLRAYQIHMTFVGSQRIQISIPLLYYTNLVVKFKMPSPLGWQAQAITVAFHGHPPLSVTACGMLTYHKVISYMVRLQLQTHLLSPADE